MTTGASFDGLSPIGVRVEVSATKGLPIFDIVGMGQVEVKEGKQRIRAALEACGIGLKHKKIIVNLGPADVKKTGAYLDVPIALAVIQLLGLSGELQNIADLLSFGELSLDGSIRSVRGGFAIVEELAHEGATALVPSGQVDLAGSMSKANLIFVSHLRDILEFIQSPDTYQSKLIEAPIPQDQNMDLMDFSQIKGHLQAKRMLTISAAGVHHVMLTGPPGVGKSLLAKAFPSIFPKLSGELFAQVKKIYSASGLHITLGDMPLRSPHHHATLAGMIGGGMRFKAGDFMLAHQGVLFMDEFPEFRRDVIEALREPLEDGVIRVRRVHGLYAYPAKFLLLAAMNLCPCGNTGDPKQDCTCTFIQLDRYRKKLSRPILDRMDLCMVLPKLSWDHVWQRPAGVSSDVLAEQVSMARKTQHQRWGAHIYNAHVSLDHLKSNGLMTSESQLLAQSVMDGQNYSIRSMVKVLRVARTIADLEGAKQLEKKHLFEALNYRFSKWMGG